MPNDIFGFDDPVRALTPPAGFETVHQDGDTWAKSDGTREGTTRLSTRQANMMAGWFRGLRTIAGLDISDLANDDPTLLREILVRSIAAALPAEVANQLPALADLLDTDIDLVAALAASADFRNAVAVDPDLVNAVAADPDLVNALAALTAFVDAVAAALPLALNADNLASGTVPDARLPGRLQEQASLQTDADAITTTGFYRLANTAANIPVAVSGYLWHIRFDASAQYQEWQQYNSNARYRRRMTGGVWGAWGLMQPVQSDQDARYAQFTTANTFTQPQTATSFLASSGSVYTKAAIAASNAHYWFQDYLGNNKAVFYWDYAGGSVVLTNYTSGVNTIFGGDGTLTHGGAVVRNTTNTPDGSNALAIAGSDTTKRAWGADDLKVSAQTWGGGMPDAVLTDQYASGTAGPVPTAGAWATRPLNTELYDPSGYITLASNEFTPSQNGWVEWQAIQRDTSHMRLRNVTDGVTVASGTHLYIGGGYGAMLVGGGPVVAGKTYRLEIFSPVANALPAATSGEVEVYTRLKYWAG